VVQSPRHRVHSHRHVRQRAGHRCGGPNAPLPSRRSRPTLRLPLLVAPGLARCRSGPQPAAISKCELASDVAPSGQRQPRERRGWRMPAPARRQGLRRAIQEAPYSPEAQLPPRRASSCRRRLRCSCFGRGTPGEHTAWPGTFAAHGRRVGCPLWLPESCTATITTVEHRDGELSRHFLSERPRQDSNLRPAA
jgi:hypothetical protein